MDALKRIFGKLFKRGAKKDKQEQDKPTRAPAAAILPTQASSKPPAAPPKDVAPQLPPIGLSEPNTTGKLPPTHPLSTGQRPQPPAAIPQDKGLQPGAAPTPALASGPESARQLEEPQEEARNVSPAEPLRPNDTSLREPVSAVGSEQEHPPAVPPKTDSAADMPGVQEVKVAEPEVAAEPDIAPVAATGERPQTL